MPEQTKQAIEWALKQDFDGEPVTADFPMGLVAKVREYFNTNNIHYDSFSYDDLIPYLPLSE
jgi:hypothetical protein